MGMNYLPKIEYVITPIGGRNVLLNRPTAVLCHFYHSVVCTVSSFRALIRGFAASNPF